MNNSYDRKPPSEADVREIHNIFLHRRGQTFESRYETNPISQTMISLSEIMHTQSRNIHGKIFGGFLIREMIELGWVAGCKYSESFIVM